MAIQQTKRQSDLEKRLQLLRRQVYGKPQYTVLSSQMEGGGDKNTEGHLHSDITYLHQDLLKIAVLSSLAIAIQLVIFFILRNGILKINFF